MIFDNSWKDVSEKLETLKTDCKDLNVRLDTLKWKYEQISAHYSECCHKINSLVTLCCDREQNFVGVPERNQQIRESFDSTDGILYHLGRLMDYEKNELEKADSSRDIYLVFYNDIITSLASKIKTLAQQLDVLQINFQTFNRDEFQKYLLKDYSSIPNGQIDSQYLIKSDRVKNQLSRLIRDINKKYQKKRLYLYYRYSLSEDISRFKKLSRMADELSERFKGMETREAEADSLLANLEHAVQEQELQQKEQLGGREYVNIYNKLRLLFTHDQLSALNSSVYTKYEYVQLVKAFCNKVRNIFKYQDIKTQ